MVRCVTIVIGMRYKVVFLNQRTNKWCHVTVTDADVLFGTVDIKIDEKFGNIPFTIYSITALTQE